MENEFKIILLKNKVNVVNYKEIKDFTFKKVTISYDDGVININGDNLVITKLLNDEILIEGQISSIINE